MAIQRRRRTTGCATATAVVVSVTCLDSRCQSHAVPEDSFLSSRLLKLVPRLAEAAMSLLAIQFQVLQQLLPIFQLGSELLPSLWGRSYELRRQNEPETWTGTSI